MVNSPLKNKSGLNPFENNTFGIRISITHKIYNVNQILINLNLIYN